MITNQTSAVSVQLVFIKLIHTIIWITMASAVLYVFYSGISGHISIVSWISVGLILVEGLALLVGKGDCPLHLYALRITELQTLNDTYLPQWLFVKYYKPVLTAVFLVGLILMILR